MDKITNKLKRWGFIIILVVLILIVGHIIASLMPSDQVKAEYNKVVLQVKDNEIEIALLQKQQVQLQEENSHLITKKDALHAVLIGEKTLEEVRLKQDNTGFTFIPEAQAIEFTEDIGNQRAVITTPPLKTVTPLAVKKKQGTIRWIEKKGASDEQNQWANTIFHWCGNDIEAVYTVEAESGFRADVVSRANSNGTRDYGLFQLNSRYHKEFIDSPQYKDPIEQIRYGCKLWKGYKSKGTWVGNRWYGYRNINKPGGAKTRFTIYHNES